MLQDVRRHCGTSLRSLSAKTNDQFENSANSTKESLRSGRPYREAGGGVRQNLKYVNAARKSSWNCCMRCIYVCVIRSSTGDDRATLASTAITAAVGADRSPDNGVAGGGRDARTPTSCRLSPGCPRPPAWSRPVGQVFRPNTNDEERKMHTQIYVER